MKIIFLMRLTRTFGPMIKIIMSMIYDISTFAVLWGVQLFFFACVGVLIFGELPEYGNIFDTLVMLFEASLGQWDMTIYDHLHIGPYVGKIFMVVVLMMNLVLLLNLIIAILSNTFMVFEPKSLSLYYDGVIDNISMYKYSKGFGALICGSPPFNILMLPFLPFYMIWPHAKLLKFNKILMWYVYAPVLVASTMAFFAINTFLLPFGYLSSLFFKINILIRDV